MDKETLEKLRRIYEKSDKAARALMEKEFPGLHETEDEKMIRIIENAICTAEGQEIARKLGFELTDLADWLEKQKPVKWSEEDERNFGMFDTILEYVYGTNPRIVPISCLDLKMWLKSIKNKVVPQEKVEWSKEDTLHLSNAILAAEKEWGIQSCTANWLKSLKQKQTVC